MMNSVARDLQAADRLAPEVEFSLQGGGGRVQDMNRALILEQMRNHKQITRPQLAKASRLRAGVVDHLLTGLLDTGWVEEKVSCVSPRFRGPNVLSIKSEIAFLVANISPGRTAIAAMDLNGAMLSMVYLEGGKNIWQVLDRMCAQMTRMRNHYETCDFKGIGISLSCHVDDRSNKILWSPEQGLEKIDIARYVQNAVGLRVELTNSANASLLSELWYGAQPRMINAAFLSVTESVETSILAEGRLTSRYHAPGPTNQMLLLNSLRPSCCCGRNECRLSDATSLSAIRTYAELSGESADLLVGELAGRVATGDAHAIAAVSRQAAALAPLLKEMVNNTQPEAVYVAGDISLYWETIKPVLEGVLAPSADGSRVCSLICIGDGEFSRLRGTATTILHRC